MQIAPLPARVLTSLFLGLASIFPLAATVSAETISGPGTLSASVEADGSYRLEAKKFGWKFEGSLPGTVTKIAGSNGSNALGKYREISFRFSGAGQDFTGTIRLYDGRDAALFTRAWPRGSTVAPLPFPDFHGLPPDLFSFSYANDAFAPPAFKPVETSTPWLFFNAAKEALILSPASHFICAKMVGDGRERAAIGFQDNLKAVPPGFTQEALMVAGQGINHTWDLWGSALTMLEGKKPIPNDADPILKYFGYWTDNGAAYWYKYDQKRGYQGTMEDVIASYRAEDIPVRYLQLDSWWYFKTTTRYDGVVQGPKDSKLPAGEWNRYGGTTRYEAHPFIFPEGLKAFQDKVQLPFITHNRWIDPTSPYHQRYRISGIAAVDPGFWNEIGTYLHDNGVVSYEQDWMVSIVKNSPELTSTTYQGDAFLDSMAGGMRAHGLDMQYCMAPPSCFMQGSKYANLTNIRTANDHFIPDRYHHFLYTSRLAWSLGIYPWSDVFQSAGMSNFILSVLSAGPVGTGDAVGKESKENILQAVRADGVIVKPDVPAVPTDEAFLAEAQGRNLPTLATTYTDHAGLETLYGIAVPRGKEPTDALTVTTAELGYAGPVYLYHYLDGTGERLAAGASFTISTPFGESGFFTIAPVGPSGIAFLGDAGKIVGTGKQRIASLHEDGRELSVTVIFAEKEISVKLHGYAATAPRVSVEAGKAAAVDYDAATKHFSVIVTPDASIAARVSNGDPVREMKVAFRAGDFPQDFHRR